MTPTASARVLVGLATDPATPSSYHHKAHATEPSEAAGDLVARAELARTTAAWLG